MGIGTFSSCMMEPIRIHVRRKAPTRVVHEADKLRVPYSIRIFQEYEEKATSDNCLIGMRTGVHVAYSN